MTINDYRNYDVEDFVEDEHFRKWILGKDSSLNFFWKAYLKKYPDQKENMEEAQELIVTTHDFFHQKASKITPPNDGFSNKLEEMLKAENPQLPLPKKEINRKKFFYLVAASVAFLLTFSTYFLLDSPENRIEYTTGNGEWKEITLPDGSKVELNANSQLSLIKEWEEGHDRMVWLKGEAFFEVEKKHTSGAKFTVTTKDLKVEVLGTAFNVNTRKQHTEVFLEEGKITLELDDDKKEVIKPGEFIAYSQEKKQILNRYKKVEDIHSNWKNGILKITDAPIKDILTEIELIYGIDLIIRNKELLTKEGTIAIPVDNLELASAILERVLNVKVERKEKQLFIN